MHYVMKNHSSRSFTLKLAAGFFAGLGAIAAHAQVVLNIDVSNPADVIFTATGASAAADATGTYNFQIQLKDFLTSNPGGGTVTATTTSLTSVAGNQPLDSFLWGRFNPVETTMILRHGVQTETFLSGTVAFTGRADVDLSDISSYLPSLGATGNIVVSLGGSGSGTTIGTYYITVPEPADFGLAAAGAALAFAGWRKRRELFS